MSADAVGELVSEYGVRGRVIREVVVALASGSWTLETLVREFAVPRRTIEEVLAAVGDDLADGSSLRVRSEVSAGYRERFGAAQLRATALADPLGPALASAGDLLAAVTRWRAAAPPPRRALDHVAATPETAVRRALWLDASFDLDGAHLLCVGDHDLTALTTCLLRPSSTATVVDVDERLLAFIDGAAEASGLAVRCVFGDLRFGLPSSATGVAGLAFTDPPYTPDGVRLFLERAIEGLDGPGRILLAYGFSERTPALGLAVQQTFGELELVVEAQLPAFSRYLGAQAVGSASDLYVLQPTAKARRRGARSRPTIYTHGEQSAEGAAGAAPEVVAALIAAAAGPEGLPVLGVAPDPTAFATAAGGGGPVGGGGPGGTGAGVPVGQRALAAVWGGGIPGPARNGAVAVDATADPGAWLLRILLAVDARRLAVAVPNNHPDLADAAGQRALADLVAPKWALTFRRSTPNSTSALVEAVRVDDNSLVRYLLDRAHGKVANVWRDGLATLTGRPRQPVAEAPAGTLLELPRHRLEPLFTAMTESMVAKGIN
ncbi:bis-aminopropyl spermidine synthase family protein [Cryptosporangium phraense]|uniref:Putative methyltransferase n=1 Tax=Cryptosporangium phraense TaxID=2593070 RepID=A0A545AQP6_9ACTN|nr:bis-aminopropyl spermidine synthase family protein [Cryptosporangium phraense]TQS43646.1 putative methyltransferase [Cryptosporangium phraense]